LKEVWSELKFGVPKVEEEEIKILITLGTLVTSGSRF
jgi:hypothetical protein